MNSYSLTLSYIVSIHGFTLYYKFHVLLLKKKDNVDAIWMSKKFVKLEYLFRILEY